MEDKISLVVDGLTKQGAGRDILKDISFKVRKGECWAITGNSGSGKSTLLSCIRQYKYYPGKIALVGEESPNVALIPHQHVFKNLSGINNFYYQQRFNSSEAEDAKTVMQEMLEGDVDREEVLSTLEMLKIEYLADTPLIQLSNGEHKRCQIAKSLLQKADWILLDDPFTGLDVRSRELLDELIVKILKQGVHVLIVNRGELPSFITHVLVLKDGVQTGVFDREAFLESKFAQPDEEELKFSFNGVWARQPEASFAYAVRMNDVNIRYHGKDILSGIDWEVKKGEKWTVSGPNGSGKSTLLSLINGDNPQAFANDVYLFDRKRGSGETIWEIKKKIGYVSPELHQHYDKSFSLFDTVASGLFDTIGLFKKLNEKQRQLVYEVLSAFHIEDQAQKLLGSLSHGKQRWVLLARALVKNPPLLILDEPCQGLDNELRNQFVSMVDQLCMDTDRTLIYVTHVDEEVPDCITHRLKLEKGKIKEKSENGKEHHSDSRRRYRAGSYA